MIKDLCPVNDSQRPRTPRTVLVVDDELAVRTVMQEYLNTMHLTVLLAPDGPTAMKLIRQHEPDLVLTDVMMVPMNGLELLKAIKAERPETAVVVFTGFSTEDMIIEALRSGAIDYMKKPFELKTLEAVVSNALRFQAALDQRELEIDCLVQEEKVLLLPNDPERISGAIRQLTVCASKFLSRSRLQELTVALYEIILNAMEHGNLEITGEEKARHLQLGDYKNLLDSRRRDVRLADRHVRVHYHLDQNGLRFAVQDQGPGFDWRALNQRPGVAGANLAAHGRGLILTRFYVDRLEFNETGNEVRLTILAEHKGE